MLGSDLIAAVLFATLVSVNWNHRFHTGGGCEGGVGVEFLRDSFRWDLHAPSLRRCRRDLVLVEMELLRAWPKSFEGEVLDSRAAVDAKI